MRKTILTIILMCSMVFCQAQKKVWTEPATDYCTSYGDGYFKLAMDITKVELTKDETRVFIHISKRADINDSWFQFTKATYLRANGVRYPLVSADGIELDVHCKTDKDNQKDVVFHFKPLPLDTKEFDFIEGDGYGAFQFLGVKPVEERYGQLLPSYWRNTKTGNWEIAFLDECVIYDNKFWDYKERPATSKNVDKATFTITNAGKELQVSVGENKKGHRIIQIGDRKDSYDMITGRFLPDYPTKDTRDNFVDTDYKADTVTFIGWLKDMPEPYKSLNTFELSYNDIFTDNEVSNYGQLDSLGRFIVKFPLTNSSAFYCDWRRTFIRTMLEPGKTYFMLYDFKEGRRLFMGDDVRLQNELMKYPTPEWGVVNIDYQKNYEESDFDALLVSADSLLKAKDKELEQLTDEHPNLSARYQKYYRGNVRMAQGRNIGQARFRSKTYMLPDNLDQYAYENFWKAAEKPYSLHRGFGGFINDYFANASERNGSRSISYNYMDHIEEFVNNEEELNLVREYKEKVTDINAKIQAETDTTKMRQMAEDFNTRNADLIKSLNNILNDGRASKAADTYFFNTRLNETRQILDSLGADQNLKDILIYRSVHQKIDQERHSIAPNLMDTVMAIIQMPAAKELISKENEKYLAIENREFDKLILKSNDDVKGISDGEALLKKILEPLKGKVVLLDIWGTWCSPCKEALSHSKEEYARLAPYDMTFLYLANRSPQQSWENVIKEYEVTGDNVVHYNLPDEQQNAIEQYLQVHSFPTYKLIDKQGNVLDINVDARDLNNIEELIKSLCQK